MKIDFNSIDREKFVVDESIILSQSESVFFVRPNPLVKELDWTQDNKIYCSSLWNAKGELISAGFPYFPNWGENEKHFPTPKTLNDSSIYEKMDGILLIVSQYKNHRIVRTKNLLDAEQLPGANEIRSFKEIYINRLADYFIRNNSWNYSFLFEWLSPTNRLIVNYGNEPRFVLVGAIYNENYTFIGQKDLDIFANGIGLERPSKRGANSIEDLINDVSKWDTSEGVVVMSYAGENIHKIKSNWYLSKLKI